MTAVVESFGFSAGTTDAVNEAAFVAALNLLAPDANDHVFFFIQGGKCMVAKVPV